jgi:hypothetical protein
VHVQVDEPRALARQAAAGHGAHPDGAVAAQHEQVMAGAEAARDRVAHPSRRLGHLSRVLCPRLRPVGTPAKLRHVSEIEQVAGGRQPFHQTGLAQRRRGTLLAGRERAGAGRNAQDDQVASAHRRQRLNGG